ncbi:glycosyltransferase family 15 protein [Amanita muscaria Koide BX008]|uniref:Glycosyltransferase family 15 protein n=1 Tax=Amanita muscaria (strain Koide BX008) TaxID=946122 RepID=A0A0C2SS20_AMAMK|nr:glycosyltransferase family 15 protein [Amanita muscaria Koide BX008]
MLGISRLFWFLAVAGTVYSTFTPTHGGLTGTCACASIEAQCKADHQPQVKIASDEHDQCSFQAPHEPPATLLSPPNSPQLRAPLLPVVEAVELDEDGYEIDVDKAQSVPQTCHKEHTTANPLDEHVPDILVHVELGEEDLFGSEESQESEEQSLFLSSPGEDSSNDTVPLFSLSHCATCEPIDDNQPMPDVLSAYTDPIGKFDEPINRGEFDVINVTAEPRRANAVIFMLTRNSDLPGVLSTVKQVEDRFNKRFQYPYVFLNDDPFEERFKSLVSQLTDVPVQFGVIPPDHWDQPSWINESRASAAREELVAQNVPYADRVSYRNMCRFNSGFFYKHELLKSYRYYWRIEPDVKFFCDIDYDPFLYMQDNDKVYGFTIALYEFPKTVTTLWDAVKEFMDANPGLIPADNAIDFVSDVEGLFYSYCHFWSNFEIADLEFWRDDAYSKFFDFLDQQGGFYYERWGDAPVHSIAVALFARKDQIHFFNDIGYRHEPLQHCPQGDAHKKGKCWCDPAENFDYDKYRSCLPRFKKLFKS